MDTSTGTCFIQKIYAPEEEEAYIFLMKQVPVDTAMLALGQTRRD
jgi:hypothetical protein